MSVNVSKHSIAPVGDLDGAYLHDFWTAWEDDVPPAPPPRWRPHLVLVPAGDRPPTPKLVLTK